MNIPARALAGGTSSSSIGLCDDITRIIPRGFQAVPAAWFPSGCGRKGPGNQAFNAAGFRLVGELLQDGEGLPARLSRLAGMDGDAGGEEGPPLHNGPAVSPFSVYARRILSGVQTSELMYERIKLAMAVRPASLARRPGCQRGWLIACHSCAVTENSYDIASSFFICYCIFHSFLHNVPCVGSPAPVFPVEESRSPLAAAPTQEGETQ